MNIEVLIGMGQCLKSVAGGVVFAGIKISMDGRYRVLATLSFNKILTSFGV
ncbi:MAG: hypothetical protein L3J53_05830 [Proteobacteria bacterium]|nr:hypothetical protein [Pseudomonadota bacterium]